jgi:hypothetical protein
MSCASDLLTDLLMKTSIKMKEKKQKPPLFSTIYQKSERIEIQNTCRLLLPIDFLMTILGLNNSALHLWSFVV